MNSESLLENKCLNCNKNIVNNKKYCNRSCYYKRNDAIDRKRECRRCGKTFILKNLAYEKRGQGIFCSGRCSSRRVKINENYFKDVNTPEKAYWLGFLYADGCNTGRGLSIALHSKDLSHLKRLKSALGSEHKIYHYKDKPKCGIGFSNPSIGRDLSSWGCTPRKTFTITYPNKLSKDLNRHFIRGFFDGDGWISGSVAKSNNKKYWRFGIYCESIIFLDSIRNMIESLGIKTAGTKDKKNLYVNRKDSLKILFKFLYGDDSIYLDRKKNLFCAAILS